MKFTENCYEKVIEWIEEADKIIVGFGAEWKVPFAEILFQIQEQEQWKVSLELQKIYAKETDTLRLDKQRNIETADEIDKDKTNKEGIEKIEKGYQVLRQLLADKDYFLITTNIDAYLYYQGFAKERIVAPCGDIRRLQCEETEHKVWSFFEEETNKNLVCPVCGRMGKLNILQNKPYHESGYLEDWNLYQTWLQGTMNKRILLLELGEGFQTPTVMRWPFEKMVFFQEKAILCCVHESLSMISEKIQNRAYSVSENSVDFVIRLGQSTGREESRM